MIQMSQTTTRTMIAIGSSATSAVQSGVTRSAVTSRIQSQMSSSMGWSGQTRASVAERVTRETRR